MGGVWHGCGRAPATGAIAAGLTAGYVAYKQSENKAEQREALQGAMTDPNRVYNDFAAANGLVGRGAAGFADAAKRTTDSLISSNRTLR